MTDMSALFNADSRRGGQAPPNVGLTSNVIPEAKGLPRGVTLRMDYPKVAHFTVEGVRVLMTHIGGYPGRYNPAIRKELYETRPDLFIAGHSHILKVVYDPSLNCLHINPGAAGISGFHVVRTLVRFALQAGKVTDLEVIELGKRGG